MLDHSSRPVRPPSSDFSKPLDPLTQVLLGLRLEGVEYGRCLLRTPWAVAFKEQPHARFHFVARGGSWLRTRTGDWMRLDPGSAVLLLHSGVANREMWQPQWDALVARHRVIRCDFRAYGDVTALKTEEIEIGRAKKLALFAQIEPTPELIELTKKRQKIYSSMEVRPKFADTDKAYLVGLAVTDNPASLGTEVLQFAAQNPAASPFKARKQQPDDLFAAAEEVAIEFEDAGDDGMAAKFRAILAGALAKFGAKSTTDDARFAAVAEGFEHIGEAFEKHAADTASKLSAADKTIGELKAQLADLQAKYSALDNTPAGRQRPAATGGNGALKTDC